MRSRALALFFLLVFAATSEGAALCLTTPASLIAGSHGCCGPESVSPASMTTCCAMSRPDRDSSPAGAHVSGFLVVLSCHPGFGHDRENLSASSLPSLSNDRNARPVPLYLQHLSLLI